MENPSGTIRLVVDVDKLTTDCKFSQYVEIGNVSWRLMTRWGRDNNVETLAIFVYCNDNITSGYWTCTAQVDIHLMIGNEKGLTRSFIDKDYCFTKDKPASGYPAFINKSNLLYPMHSFVQNGEFVIVANIEVKSVCDVKKVSFPEVYDTKESQPEVEVPVNHEELTKEISGTIDFEFTDVSNWTSGEKHSDIVEIGSVPWKLSGAWKTIDNIDYLALYVYCEHKSTSNLWTCDALVSLILGNEQAMVQNFGCSFKNNVFMRSFETFIKKEELLHAENGFVTDDKFKIVASIGIKSIVGVRENRTTDFSIPQKIKSEVTLLVEEHKLYVDKNILVSFSSVFRAMFLSNFRERNKKEILINAVNYTNFIAFLSILHRKHQKITDENVEGLLELSDIYDVQFLMRDCENFLKKTDKISNGNKLRLSEMYSLSNLQEETLKKLTTVASIKAVHNGLPDIGGLTSSILLEKMCNLAN